ncbi:MAG TPA: Co2+/Mg2+ efflux protein ApaG [Myxococcales bacterium]|nr:Co2+/Mg2+ efflux protein ApaG [Myxococcales bacterium]
MSEAITEGIRVKVESTYVPDQSSPRQGRYAFAYRVHISNEGASVAQLRSRHWIITDGNGERQEVRGDGVVGEQPVLQPGEHFEYTSGCLLKTPHGSMHGSYRMARENGTMFEAKIAPFSLTLPNALN